MIRIESGSTEICRVGCYVHAMIGAGTGTSDVDGPLDRKGVLFCPDCEHASPIDGDWIVEERAASLELRCPDCGTILTERERERRREDPADPVLRIWAAWLRTVAAWIRPFGRRRTRV